jgi:hypothetical protein
MASVHSEFVRFVKSGHLSASCSLGFPRTLKISFGASRLSTTVVPVGDWIMFVPIVVGGAAAGLAGVWLGLFDDPLVAVGVFAPEFGAAGVVAPAMDAAKAFVDAAAPCAASLLAAGMSFAFLLLPISYEFFLS